MIRKRIEFTGQVQGVGFRWRARKAANLYDCIGWCRNNWDGSVTMEIQGTEESIDKVIQKLDSDRYIWIHGMEEKEIPTESNEWRFGVRE